MTGILELSYKLHVYMYVIQKVFTSHFMNV